MALEHKFPGTKAPIKRAELVWEGDITPSPMSRSYRCKIVYKFDETPKVWIVEPKPQKRDGRRCEHMYEDDRPCLYYPGRGEWDEGMLLVDTIVPWTSEWLEHYEVWLATGEWQGRGEHPQPKTDRPRRERMDLRNKWQPQIGGGRAKNNTPRTRHPHSGTKAHV